MKANSLPIKILVKLILTILILTTQINSKLKIDHITKTLRDEKGRSTILHGVNIVVKRPPYIPDTEQFDPMNSLSDEDIKIMKNLGFNFVRLGIMWESVERSEKQYDLEYLGKMKEIIRKLGENGIYTLIDIHQDIFSRIFCGEGVPVFYAKNLPYKEKCDDNLISYILNIFGVCKSVKSFNWKYDENGLPEIESCRKDFVKTTSSAIELNSSYNLFYENVNNIKDNFLNFLEVLLKFFKGNEYVIGLDPWNEPMPKNLFSDLSNFLPSRADDKYLIPLYKDVYNRLKNIDKDLIYLLEPLPFPDTIPAFGGIFLPSFSDSPLGKENVNKQIFNVHSYCCEAGAEVCENENNEPNLETAKTTCKSFHSRKIKQNKAQGDKMGIQTMITEFGACSDSEACFYELKGLLDAADENMISWAYWMYKPYKDHTTSANSEIEGLFYKDGTLQKYKEKALSRTYIQKYPGVPLKAMSNPEADGYYWSNFIYENNKENDQELILYLNKKLNYPNFENDFDVRLFDELSEEKIEFEIKMSSEEYNFDNENYLEIRISKNNEKFNGRKLILEIAKNK